MSLELESLEKAVISLETAVEKARDESFMSKLDESTANLIKAGVIQNFEFTYELCWKYMKRWISENRGKTYVEGISIKSLFRLSCENILIYDFEKWLEFHKARNLTSHTYNQNRADEVYEIAKDFVIEARKLLEILKEKND